MNEATRQGYELTDTYIRKLGPDEPYIECEAEEDIFRILGLQYKPPNQRDNII